MTSRALQWLRSALQRAPVGLVLFLAASAYGAQIPSAEQVLKQLSRTVNFRESKIAPDGRWVAWAEAVRNPDGSESEKSRVYIDSVSSAGHAMRITGGDGRQDCEEGDVAWAPDSSALFFLSDCREHGQAQIYRATVSGHAGERAQKLSSLTGDLNALAVSPDGHSVAFLFLEGARAVGPRDAYTPELGVVASTVHEQRVAVLNLASGRVESVSPADLFVYEFTWSPDSKQIAYVAAPGEGTNNWWIARLYRLSLESREQKLLVKPEAQIAEPHWSPDGESIAYIGGLMSDQGVVGGDVFLVAVNGAAPVNLTPGRPASASWLRWKAGTAKQKLLVGDLVDGGAAISELNIGTRAIERLWQGDESLEFGDVASDGRTMAAIRSSWRQAPEVWAGEPGSWSAITHRNDSQHPLWGKFEKVHWSNGGFELNGWLLYPARVDPDTRYRMVVSIHGGPASQKSPRWPEADHSILATQGMFVFFPNPRGSYGQGEAFTRANVKDFGHGDLSDILTGVDQVLKQAPVDPMRLGVGGWSYGGFMTMWTVTQTHRFRAAVAGAGIANWQSYYGENLIDQWMIPYFGASVYDDPAVYAKSSPINFIKNVTTPTLVIVGDRDAECPMPQSREFWHALKTLGVETQLVVYPNEGHHFRDPAHILDMNKRQVEWFREHLK